MDFETGVKQTLDSGVEAITIECDNIYSCSNHRPVAFRTYAKINSTLLGVLTPDEYNVIAESTDRGVKLASRCAYYAVKKIDELLSQRIGFEFIIVRCPVNALYDKSFYEEIVRLLGEEEKYKNRLCLEFPAKILFEDPAKAKEPILNYKGLGVKLLINAFGSEYCPIMRLAYFPVDYVSLTSACAAQMKDEKISFSVNAIVSYCKGLHCGVIATGLEDDNESENFSRADCFGYRKVEEPHPLFE